MIHYHGTPLSGDNFVAIRALKGKHAMVSFAASGQMEIVAEVCQSFCIDNGAFTTWKTGKAYDIEKYAEFISDWHTHPGFDFYCIPDVIDGDEKENLAMVGKWRNLVNYKIFNKGAPVWHMHEAIEVLKIYVHAYDRVCIGSSGEYAVVGDNKWWSRIAEAMSAICDDGRPRAKLHGLRMLDPTIFSHLPLSSADSTNVARNIGIDGRWNGSYAPRSRETRAAILMERIESHASAAKWNGSGVGAMPNGELFG